MKRFPLPHIACLLLAIIFIGCGISKDFEEQKQRQIKEARLFQAAIERNSFEGKIVRATFKEVDEHDTHNQLIILAFGGRKGQEADSHYFDISGGLAYHDNYETRLIREQATPGRTLHIASSRPLPTSCTINPRYIEID